MMKVGDLVSISAKYRRRWYSRDNPMTYTYGIVIAAPLLNGAQVRVVVQWINGERVSMLREDLKYAKHPKRPSSKRKVKNGNL
jgi:hypothetical protein